jgi:Ca2+/H+ antiporter
VQQGYEEARATLLGGRGKGGLSLWRRAEPTGAASFAPVALAALAIAIVMIGRITDNRNVNWYEGVQLIVLLSAMATGALLLMKP